LNTSGHSRTRVNGVFAAMLLFFFLIDSVLANTITNTFLPYKYCLLGKIISIKRSGFDFLTEVRVDENLKSDTPVQQKIFLVTTDSPPSFPTHALKKKPLIICFNNLPPVYADDLRRQFGSQSIPAQNVWITDFKVGTLTSWKNLCTSSSKLTSQEKRSEFQKYLEERWTAERIADFCNIRNRWIHWYPQPFTNDPEMETWSGRLSVDPAKNIRVSWKAPVFEGIPQTYSIQAEGKDGSFWNLETSNPSIGSWNDKEYLTFRVSKELSNVSKASSHIEVRSSAEAGYRASSLEKAFNRRHDEQIKITPRETIYQCLIGEKVLSAILDNKRHISVILVNGKKDTSWNKALAECDSNIDQINAKLGIKK